jgi:hypothetical protein
MNLKELLTICENYERLPIEVQGCLLSLAFNQANPQNIDAELLKRAHKFLSTLTNGRNDGFVLQALSMLFEIEGVLENEQDT